MGTGYEEYEPYARGDGQVLYFTSPKPAPGDQANTNIWRAFFAGDAFMGVELARDIDTKGGERAPVVSEDDRVIYYASTLASAVDYDIYVATRPSRDDPFGAPTRIPEVSSTSFDFPTWVSPDLCTLYFKSLRSGKGADDIYVAKRTKKN